MSEVTAGPARKNVAASAVAVQGTTWFGALAALWSAWVTLLLASGETLERTYDWLTGLAIVWEVVMWIVLLPWALAYVLWESSWDHGLRVALLVLLIAAHLLVSVPRVRR